jgi:hypothetical protein
VPYAGIEAPLKVIGENAPNQLGINLMIHETWSTRTSRSSCRRFTTAVRPISLTLGTTKTTLASGKATNSEAHRIAFVSKGQLLNAVCCDLFFEIGANVLTSGERHHLTILISTLRHIVTFGRIQDCPKVSANLTRLWLLVNH